MRLRFDGLNATVDVPDRADFIDALRATAVDWPFTVTEDAAEPAGRISFSDNGYFIHLFGEDPIPATPVGAACSLVVSLAEALVIENPQRLCFHGGAVRFGDRLVVMPARARAGKSTMIARLAAAGHTVFGDDILPLDEKGNGVALGVAPRLRLPLPACASAQLRDFVAAHAGPADHRYHYLALPGEQLAPRGTAAPLGAILLLDRRSAGPATIHGAPGHVALKLLARQSVMRTDDTRALLAQMHGMIQGLPLYVLGYSDLEDGAQLLQRTFASWDVPINAPPVQEEAALMGRLLAPDHDGDASGGRDELAGYRPDLRVVANPVVSLHKSRGEAFLAGTGETAGIYHLNPVGTAIWNLLGEPTDEVEVSDLLASAFPDVDREVISNDVAALFRDLYRSGFLIEAVVAG
ncbi:PqqD family protein [Mesorhizobium sp. CAU 1741]|uniref:PqqD family protein n=1 Tax=Mesorhizobium sp. CAU 1741 TaxID=3140366 RepID=UPI00325A6E16